MRVSSRSDQHGVFDDVLSGEARDALLAYARTVPLGSPHAEGYQRVWSFEDGAPWFGPAAVAYTSAQERRRRKRVAPPEAAAGLYPTETAVDLVLDRLLRSARRLEPWIGKRGEEWIGIAARLAVYPQGTGLSWHDDAQIYSGAFTYYLHPEWAFEWGGELMLLDGPPDRRLAHRIPPRDRPSDPLRGRCLPSEAYTRTEGRFVVPVPNRLVVLRGGVTHGVNPVKPAAGRVPRMAISGFFVSPGSSS